LLDTNKKATASLGPTRSRTSFSSAGFSDLDISGRGSGHRCLGFVPRLLRRRYPVIDRGELIGRRAVGDRHVAFRLNRVECALLVLVVANDRGRLRIAGRKPSRRLCDVQRCAAAHSELRSF
jgi:hypothetical protein